MKSFTNRRALSSVVTTAMMLTAVAVIGTGVVVWSNYNLRAFENVLVTTASNNTNKINEVPIFENIVFVPYISIIYPDKYVNTTITNVGTIGFKVSSITITDSTHNTPFINSTSVNINPKSSKLLFNKFSWTTGVPVTITVITARGTVISTQVIP